MVCGAITVGVGVVPVPWPGVGVGFCVVPVPWPGGGVAGRRPCSAPADRAVAAHRNLACAGAAGAGVSGAGGGFWSRGLRRADSGLGKT